MHPSYPPHRKAVKSTAGVSAGMDAVNHEGRARELQWLTISWAMEVGGLVMRVQKAEDFKVVGEAFSDYVTAANQSTGSSRPDEI